MSAELVLLCGALLSSLLFFYFVLRLRSSDSVVDTKKQQQQYQVVINTMSAEGKEGGNIICCASCGIAEEGDCVAKLKKCDACNLVQYCSDKCKQEHRPKHERACKKRAAELRDEILFKQPESTYLGDCPICLLPLSLDLKKCVMQSCCSKWICRGCSRANIAREMEEKLERKCPFCREPTPATKEEGDMKKMKRVEANDPVALCEVGKRRWGEGDYERAFEYLTKAAGLGGVDAHFNLSVMYHFGYGVEKDEKMELHHLEEAAIGGHPDARHNLASYEGRHRRNERAIRHLIIAATLGDDDAIKKLQEVFMQGTVSKDVFSKEDFAAALRAYQAAVDATKSPQREEAEKPWQQKPLDRTRSVKESRSGGGKSSKQGRQQKQLEKKVMKKQPSKKL